MNPAARKQRRTEPPVGNIFSEGIGSPTLFASDRFDGDDIDEFVFPIISDVSAIVGLGPSRDASVSKRRRITLLPFPVGASG